MPSKEKIEGMFDNIAKDYDSLNHIMSLSIDKIWRRKAIKKIKDAGEGLRHRRLLDSDRQGRQKRRGHRRGYFQRNA